MNKIYLIILSIALVLFISSCQEVFDPGATEAESYAGDWYYGVYGGEGDLQYPIDALYSYESPLLTYNTSSNTSNEIWVDDQDLYWGLKAKVTVTGDAMSFSSGEGINLSYVAEPEAPASGGVTIKDTIDDYAIFKIDEAKIMTGAATVWADREHAPADSIYMKFTFYPAVFTYVSKEIDTESTGKKIILERTGYEILPDWSDTYIIQGHRQTGWEVEF